MKVNSGGVTRHELDLSQLKMLGGFVLFCFSLGKAAVNLSLHSTPSAPEGLQESMA